MERCGSCGAPRVVAGGRCDVCRMPAAVPTALVDRAQDFVAKPEALGRIDTWLREGQPVCLVTGDPGVGKSALLAWLAGAGPAAPADPTRERVRDALGAVHFCMAKRSRTAASLDPTTFANSLVRQLSASVAGYGDELLRSADRNIEISVVQRSQTVSGAVIGVQVVNLQTADPASLFRSVLEPFRRLPQDAAATILLVDALDEAELWPGTVTIGELLADVESLPPQLRVLASTRPWPAVLDRFADSVTVELEPEVAAVRAYADAWMARAGNGLAPQLVDQVVAASRGNFLYVKTALEYWSSQEAPPAAADAMSNAPGLEELYGLFLQREYGDQAGRELWRREVRPLLAALGSAQERFDAPRLRFVLDTDPDTVQDGLRRCRPYLDGELPRGPFDLYHQSFRQYLFEGARAHGFAIDEATAHATTANRYLSRYSDRWGDCHDPYGLAYTPAHLIEAAHASEQPDRHHYVAQVVDLLASRGFADARRRELADIAGFKRDVDRMLEQACADRSSSGVRLIARGAEILEEFRQTWLDPEVVFAAARDGDLAAAKERLAVFHAERHWSQATLLLAAWLAHPHVPAAAAALVERVADELEPLPTLQRLLERVQSGMSPEPPSTLAYPLTGDPDPEITQAILARMRGLGANREALLRVSEQQSSQIAHDEIGGFEMVRGGVSQIAEGVVDVAGRHPEEIAELANSTYLGGVDGPHLVACAAAHPDVGDAAVAEYVEALTANGYVMYRNRSLWALLAHVVAHPEQSWVQRVTRLICNGALGGSSVAFREAAAIAGTGIATATGRADDEELADLRSDVVASAGELVADGRSDRSLHVGDTWGHHMRRLCALADTHRLLLDDGDTAEDLLGLAMDLRDGFAGYQALACLTLAESWHIAAAHRGDAIDASIDKALTAAHCVQDPPFCARTTSRCNAIAEWWQARDRFHVGDALADEVARFVRNPHSERYAAHHRVGEAYEHRMGPDVHLPFPGWALQADTLDALSRLYERPLADFLRLNRGVPGADAPLEPGDAVNVPDPGLPCHLAGMFSAFVVAHPTLAEDVRLGLLRDLVPLASAETTTLDRVLARLALALSPADPDLAAVLRGSSSAS